ncbi:flowering time control protein FPA-like isoform X1 [Zingiber officinale]|uniref:flowering time control protein FPA-like isoform X1 n=1 Tax=Zingiber officinale TaxID=94328 RepID=UPI001C4D3383|nr:flowering time control protein FPA-like isoform X1 [Zingiber officinale]
MPINKSAGVSSDHRRPSSSKDPESSESASNTLWVGQLSAETTDSDLMDVFSKHGALDCTTMQSARNYTFVYFRQVEEAKAAKEALQGNLIHGSAIRIEFARPPRAAKQIWVGGFDSSVSKEQLKEEFLQFGKIEEYRFFRDRNSAIIEYYKLEDAIAAHKNMNGKKFSGQQLRVDFLRSQPPKREWPDRHDLRNGHLGNLRSLPSDSLRNFHNSSSLGSKWDMLHGVLQDGPPSNVLCIRYPPPVQIDQKMLHNAMILFGEIEMIKSFPARHYSFVVFRSIDEARRAKDGLQGRLFNDPRIQILYSNDELLASVSGNSLSFYQFKVIAQRSDIFFNIGPFGPLELLGHGHLIPPNNLLGSLHAGILPGTNMVSRPFGPQGLDPRHAGAGLHELGILHPNLLEVDTGKSMPRIRRSPSAPGILPSPPGIFQGVRSMPDAWDGVDMRDPKRVRLDSPPSNDDFRQRKSASSSMEEQRFLLSHPDRGVSSRTRVGSAPHHRPNLHSPDRDYIWRGVIAKGGAHVCYARCVPIGKGIDSPMPSVVNCSARTGLDMLTKHYAEAIGFEIVFFLPDSEEDFASYTEFLRYLGLKNRAGVAKLEDGTTLFLVPPSDFLTSVLNVNGPERLYGVVLNMQQQSPAAQQSQIAIPQPPRQLDRREEPLEKGYNFVRHNEEQILRGDYNNALHEEVVRHSAVENFPSAHRDEQHMAQLAPLDQDDNSSSAAASQLKATLTPELIATLASLIPSNNQSSASAAQLPSNSAARPTSSYTPAMPDGSAPFQSWRQENQMALSLNSMDQQKLPPPLGQDFNSQGPSVTNTAIPFQFPPFTNTTSGTDPATQPFYGGLQIQNPILTMQQAPAVSTNQLNNYETSQRGQFSVTQNNQLYQFDNTYGNRDNYGSSTSVTDPFPSLVQQQPRLGSSSAHSPFGNVSQHQPAMSMPNNKGNLEFTNQGQRLENILPGSSQGTTQGDADKNQRYQSTLQFAANLLLQIQQQQQQQTNANTAPGSGNHQ